MKILFMMFLFLFCHAPTTTKIKPNYLYGFKYQVPSDKKNAQQDWVKETVRAISQSTMNGRVEHPEYIVNDVYKVSLQLFQIKEEGLFYDGEFYDYYQLNTQEQILFDSLKTVFYAN